LPPCPREAARRAGIRLEDPWTDEKKIAAIPLPSAAQR